MVFGIGLILLTWIKPGDRLRFIPVALVFVLTGRYMVWRFTDTLPPADETANFILGVAFLFIELLAVAGSLLTLITLSRTKSRSGDVDRTLSQRNADHADPPVDVFICTYNEEAQILERTITGALAMDYSNYRVWVLDDGRRDWLKELATSLGCQYLTRPDNAHAKAGNINHALAHVNALPCPPEFISVLDADFVPTKRFLRRTLALLEEPDVGVVQTPQHFINPDPIQANLGAADIWPDEQRFFFDVLMPSKDAWGTSFCCGTSSVIRFQALIQAGGFPTTSVTEDYLVTLRLKQFGFRTVYLNERLSLGLAPEGLAEYITQRSRWCLGFIQILRSQDGPMSKNSLSLTDRISLIESFLYWAGTYCFRLASLVIPISFFWFEVRAVNVELGEGLANFLPYFVAQVMVIGWLSRWRIMPILTDVSQLLAMREILASVAIGLIRPKGHKFQVTAKGGDRSKIIVQWRMILFFATFLVATLYGLMISFHLDPHRTLEDSSIVALFWSWYNILLLLVAIVCCIERPRMRRAERFQSTDCVEIRVRNGVVPVKMLDVSIYGMRLEGRHDLELDQTIDLTYRGLHLAGRVARVGSADVAISLEHSFNSRLAMIREIYSGRLEIFFEGVNASKLGKRIFSELMR